MFQTFTKKKAFILIQRKYNIDILIYLLYFYVHTLY